MEPISLLQPGPVTSFDYHGAADMTLCDRRGWVLEVCNFCFCTLGMLAPGIQLPCCRESRSYAESTWRANVLQLTIPAEVPADNSTNCLPYACAILDGVTQSSFQMTAAPADSTCSRSSFQLNPVSPQNCER